MIVPWEEGTHGSFHGDAYIFNGGHTDSPADNGIHLQIVDAYGRAALSTSDPHLRFGFDATYINIDSSDPALPERLVDQSIAVGFGIGAFDGWEVGATVGVGYAGNNPFADAEALYGLANLIFSYKIDDTSSVQFLLNYDGNRTLWPDVPLPGIVYNHRVDDTLSYSVGVPYSSITWSPVDRLTLHADYALPYTFNVLAEYEVVDDWFVFGAFSSRNDAFTLDEDRDHRRLFFSQRRLEAGVRWQPSERCELLLAAGYAFDQEFEYGFDSRDLDTVRELTDEPFIRAAVAFEF